MIDMQHNAFAFAVSRDMAIDHGLVQATPEEVAERNEQSQRFHAEAKALREAWKPIIAALGQTPGLVKVMVDLHRPDIDADGSVTCPACSTGDVEREWPCETMEAVIEWCRIPLPGHWVPGKHYEGDWVPWDGTPPKPLHRSTAFIDITEETP